MDDDAETWLQTTFGILNLSYDLFVEDCGLSHTTAPETPRYVGRLEI